MHGLKRVTSSIALLKLFFWRGAFNPPPFQSPPLHQFLSVFFAVPPVLVRAKYFILVARHCKHFVELRARETVVGGG